MPARIRPQPRQVLVERLTQVLDGPDPVLLTGPAGVGKTSLAALAVAQLKEEGVTVVVVTLTGRTGERLAQLEADLGVRLWPVLRAAPTTGARVVFVDGAASGKT